VATFETVQFDHVKWEQPAVSMLDRRDRFTRPAIEREFEAYTGDPSTLSQSTIAFDPPNKGYLTPVADRRYSVIWYLEDHSAIVRAVVPTARFSPGSGLKARVEQILREATGDLIKLR
jgi:hypothetical protein